MSSDILVINSGSSSIKFGLYDGAGKDLTSLGHGVIAGIGTTPKLHAFDSNNALIADEQLKKGSDHTQSMSALLDWILNSGAGGNFSAIGHRVLHGGSLYAAPVLITDEVLNQLDKFDPLGPLHQPHNVLGIRILAGLLPNVPQVACFDTAFHCTLPKVARQFAIPKTLYNEGLKRYGFHGLSYEYMSECLPGIMGKKVAAGRVIVAHLGNGASMCAMKDGHSVATTMGFTALDGLPMGTRCGDLDAGIILYLLNERRMSSKDISDLLYNKSGLLGISGVSSDMQELLLSDAEGAREAIDFYVYRINREVGALSAIMGGLDALVFTAGVGENSATIRSRVCELAAWTGIKLDAQANEDNALRISASDSNVPVWVVPTQEELMIARHAQRLLD
tara:strand:+ start:113140 stop:114315 length:1176 start_codon:yes stop_codon:yes gene_type:complete